MPLSSTINDRVYSKLDKQFPNHKNIEFSKLLINQKKIQKIKSDENPTTEFNIGVGYNF